MKKFIYRMQSILDIKLKIEEQEKINYAAARARLLEQEHILLNMINRKEEYQEQLSGMVNDKLMIHEIITVSEAVETMKDYIKIQKQKVKREEQLVEIARQKLSAAIAERKIHEKLKENAFEDYKIMYEAEERKEIDELVSFQYSTQRV